VRGKGVGSGAPKILGGPRRQVGVGVYDHKQYVRVFGELLVQQADEIEGGIAIVHGQGTADPNYAGLLPRDRRRLARHRVLERGNALAAVALLSQLDGFLGR